MYLYEDTYCAEAPKVTKEMNYFEKIFDLCLDRLIEVTDYFIFTKKVTLSEGLIWWLSFARMVWLMFVDIDAPYTNVLPDRTWLWMYLGVSLLHTGSIFFSAKVRGVVVCVQAVLWCVLAWLAVSVGSTSFTVPTAGILAILSASGAVRLFRDK